MHRLGGMTSDDWGECQAESALQISSGVIRTPVIHIELRA
jgi:hypothetical protein